VSATPPRAFSRRLRLMAVALGLSLSLPLSLSGCAGTLHNSGKEVASGAVEGSLEEVSEPSTQQMLADTLNNPEVVEAMSNLTQAAASGVLDGLTEPERAVQLQRATDAVVAHLGQAFARSLDEDIRPVLAKTIAQSVQM